MVFLSESYHMLEDSIGSQKKKIKIEIKIKIVFKINSTV